MGGCGRGRIRVLEVWGGLGEGIKGGEVGISFFPLRGFDSVRGDNSSERIQLLDVWYRTR